MKSFKYDDADDDDAANTNRNSHWVNEFNLLDCCLVDKEVFLGKREPKTVLREPLGTLTTTTGKQCDNIGVWN